MKKVTNEQLAIMEVVGTMVDFEEARALFACAGVEADTAFYTEAEKNIALRARAAMYDPNGYGMYGCINEAQRRLDRSEVTCRPMLWEDFSVRRMHTDDQRIRNVNGGYYRLEHKNGAGDWYTTKANTLEKALEAYKKENKVLVWYTEDFQLVMPFADFIKGLESYKGGVETFFKKKLAYRPTIGKYTLQMQTYTTSKKKIQFLQALAQQGSSWKALYIMGELD